MRCTVAETYEYHKQARHLLSDEENDAVIDYLSMHPRSGVLIRGTGGVRKLRWAHENKGKSGGVRIIYYYHSENIPLYLLSLFSKGEKNNLSKQECNELAKLTRLIKQAAR